ncbi:hypothetical protein C5167_029948 [Papaver somniferum]|nr:hypothetical protein C5167_029948 [Papaver somniferum]
MHDRGVQKNEYFPVSYYEWKIDGTKMSRSVYRRNPNENRSPVLIEQHGPSSISSSSGNWKFIREKLVKNEDDWSIAETGSSAFKSLRNSLMLNACPELMAQNGGANPKSSKVTRVSLFRLNGADIILPEWMFSKICGVQTSVQTEDQMRRNTDAEKKLEDFTFIYQQMLHPRCHFNTRRHIMLLEACRAGKGELLGNT